MSIKKTLKKRQDQQLYPKLGPSQTVLTGLRRLMGKETRQEAMCHFPLPAPHPTPRYCSLFAFCY